MTLRLLFCGDIMGQTGRKCVVENMPTLRKDLRLDCVIVNGENAAHGFGLTAGICQELKQAGVDVITSGNHIFGNRDIIPFMDHESYVLRPLNYPTTTPGKGYTVFKTPKGHKILVANVMGRVFMEPLDDPFQGVGALLNGYTLGGSVNAIVLDIHCEATSEKMAMGHFCDGRVSLVVGTHTHIPTADAHILAKGTGYMTDAGMCGDYHSVVGMKMETPLYKFIKRMPAPNRMEPANGPATLCGVYVEINPQTGLCENIKPVRIGPHLDNTLPVVT